MRFFEHLIVWFPLIVECSFGIIYFVCYFCGWNREAFSARFLSPVYQNPLSSFSTSTFGERYRQSLPIHTCFLFQTFPPPQHLPPFLSILVGVCRCPQHITHSFDFLSSFGVSFGERVQKLLLFSKNPFPFPYSLHIHQTSTFFPMTGREVQNASCE